MRKITSYYFLGFPNDSPINPNFAATEMRVEVGEENSTTENFNSTYAFWVCTKAYVVDLLSKQPFLAQRSILVVDRLDDECVKSALANILDRIETVGIAEEDWANHGLR